MVPPGALAPPVWGPPPEPREVCPPEPVAPPDFVAPPVWLAPEPPVQLEHDPPEPAPPCPAPPLPVLLPPTALEAPPDADELIEEDEVPPLPLPVEDVLSEQASPIAPSEMTQALTKPDECIRITLSPIV
jgi:hypothetical protein